MVFAFLKQFENNTQYTKIITIKCWFTHYLLNYDYEYK